MKALIISHAHPDFSIGGAQVASHNLHLGLRQQPGWTSHYLAGIGDPVMPHRDTPLMALDRAEDESLFWSKEFDWFHLGSKDVGALMAHFERFLVELQPDIVNMHHVMGFGVQAIRSIRRALGDVPIVYTLHEYLPICAHHGQMIKPKTHALCQRATPSDCGMCFPGDRRGEPAAARDLHQELLRSGRRLRQPLAFPAVALCRLGIAAREAGDDRKRAGRRHAGAGPRPGPGWAPQPVRLLSASSTRSRASGCWSKR